MAEYIERENAIESIKKHFPYRASSDFYDGQNDCINQLEVLPAADVVKVVRCKDCKHWGGEIFGYICRRFSGSYIRNETRETDFCSYGELKELKEDETI